MHILFIGATGPTERGIIIKACKENALEHKEVLQPSVTAPLIQGHMGIMREAPQEDLRVRVAREVEVLNTLSPEETAGIVLGALGARIALTRFGLARDLQEKHPNIPILVIEEPSTMIEVIRYYGGNGNVVRFEGVELAPPRIHIITEDPKIPEHIRAFVGLCARRLSAS